MTISSRFNRQFSQILQENQHLMAQTEVMDLQSDLQRLAGVAKALKSHKFGRTKRTPVPKIGSKNVPRTRKTDRPRPEREGRGMWINGVACCRVCKRPIPHKTKAENQFHMLAVKRRWMQKAAKVAWLKIGYHKLNEASVRARRATALQDRVEAFRELAPVMALKMSDDEIMRLAQAYKEPRGYMWSLQMWRVHVRRHYR